MIFEKTEIEGCYKIIPRNFQDERGAFIKIFNNDEFLKEDLGVNIREQYYSISKPNVLRGMHFQLPPKDHFKIVTCISGEVLDVVLDLRKDSDTYKKCASFVLNESNAQALYIPKGVAHGFYVPGNKDAIMLYNTETVYDGSLDSGVRYDSIDFQWPIKDKPVMSKRDLDLIRLENFNSPF